MDDREFIEGVWRKARYLEYAKLDEERVKENEKKIYKEKFHHIAIMSACMLLTAGFLFLLEFSMFLIIAGGSFLLGMNVLYEYIRDLKFERKEYYGHRNQPS